MRPRLCAMFVALILLVAVLGMAGCWSSGSDTHVLDGTAWRLTGWTLSSLHPNGFTITAKFADGTSFSTSAVTTYSGPYTAGPGDAFLVGDLASTRMAGPEPDMRAEGAYLKLLSEAEEP